MGIEGQESSQGWREPLGRNDQSRTVGGDETCPRGFFGEQKRCADERHERRTDPMNQPKAQPMFERQRALEDKPDGHDLWSAVEAAEKGAAPLVGPGALVLQFEEIAAAAPFADADWNRTLQDACMALKRARCGLADAKLTIEWQERQLADLRRVIALVAKHADFSQCPPEVEEEVDRAQRSEGGPAS